MPLTRLQHMVAEVLRPFRDEHNFVAGGVSLNQRWPRLSDDMDIFHDRRNQLPNQVEPELRALRDTGFSVEITTEDEWMVEAIVRKFGFETRVQWMDEPETCRRFFPALIDDELGFRLHQADVAVNKVLCASRRREARDAVDIATIVHHYAPLGPLVWAAGAKETAESPLQLVQNIRTNAFSFSDEEIRTVRMDDGQTMTRNQLRENIAHALGAARRYCEEVAPPNYLGCLFVDENDKPVEADAAALAIGSIRAIPLTDFSTVPAIGDSAPRS